MRQFIPNIISFLRIPCALAILLVPVPGAAFFALYLFCGLSDILDGILARELDVSSSFGEKLDSFADLIFIVTCSVRLLPLVTLPKWVIAWIAAIAAVKAIAVLKDFFLTGRLGIRHSYLNKLTGVTLFLTAIIYSQSDFVYYLIPVCIAASLAAFEDLLHRGDR